MKSKKANNHRAIMLFPFDYYNEGAIVIASFQPHIDQVLKIAKTQNNSHAELMLIRAWNSIFRGLIDLNQMFVQYYCREYNDFSDFMEKFYGCNETLVKRIVDARLENLFIGYARYKNSRFSDLIFGESHYADDEPLPFSKLFNIYIDYSVYENQI